MHPIARQGKTNFNARALLIGERLDLRSFSSADRIATDPVTVAAGAGGLAVLFRYGAVVLFDVAPLEEGELLRQLLPLVRLPYAAPETESLEIRIEPGVREGLESNTLLLNDYAIERFQLVADVLSKSTVLAFYESRASRSFELVEPFAASLEQNRQSQLTARELLRQIGAALLSEHNLIGRVEVGDKPELIWEHPDLERFYVRLEDEFEISERHRVLERKFDLLSRTAETIHELLQTRRSLRLEWYIVILIVIEVALSIYQIFLQGGRHF